jgi:flagellar hook-basal body complex protein FliE
MTIPPISGSSPHLDSPGVASILRGTDEPGPFARLIRGVLASANAQEAQADRAVQDFALGKTENVHDVMLAVAKADITFRLLLEIRNRLTEALQEIMRMQV